MFELAMPWALIALPLPWLIWYACPRVVSKLSTAVRVPFFDAMQLIANEKKQPVAHNYPILVLFLIWALVLLAFSGPRFVGEPRPLARDGYNILLALDLSASMQVGDMALNGQPLTRLAVVKRAAKQFVEDRAGDKIGLILFGTRAYVQTPLTFDHHNVLMRIDDAAVGLAGGTTSIGDALGLAVKRLQHVPAKGRVIILLTDGANNSGVVSPLKAAELAHAEGIKVYTIGLSSDIDPQSFGGLFLQANAAADLDEDTLKAIAKKTGGRYFRATDMQSLKTIYQTINKMETVKQDQVMVRPQQEYYPYVLALSLLLLMAWLTPWYTIMSRFLTRARRFK